MTSNDNVYDIGRYALVLSLKRSITVRHKVVSSSFCVRYDFLLKNARARNLIVSLDFVSGNIAEVLGKQNSLFPQGPVIKCLLFLTTTIIDCCHLLGGLPYKRAGVPYLC